MKTKLSEAKEYFESHFEFDDSHLKDNESKKKFQNNMFLNFLKEFNKDLYKQLER